MATSAHRRKNIERYREMERLRQQRARNKVRELISEIKTSQGCLDCDENHPAVLQFHHRDPSTKLFRISRAVAEKTPMPLILAEIEKCDVLCANCHAKRHWEHVK